MADKIPDISPNVDETMKELETHGSFELPVETYTDNCEISAPYTTTGIRKWRSSVLTRETVLQGLTGKPYV